MCEGFIHLLFYGNLCRYKCLFFHHKMQPYLHIVKLMADFYFSVKSRYKLRLLKDIQLDSPKG